MRECFLISLGCLLRLLLLFEWQGTAMFTKVTKDWNLLAPPRAPFLPLFLCFALLRGGFYLNSFASSEFVLGVLCPVVLRGWLYLSERGGR